MSESISNANETANYRVSVLEMQLQQVLEKLDRHGKLTDIRQL